MGTPNKYGGMTNDGDELDKWNPRQNAKDKLVLKKIKDKVEGKEQEEDINNFGCLIKIEEG